MKNIKLKVLISAIAFNLLINSLHAQLKDNGIYISDSDFINKHLQADFNKKQDIRFSHVNNKSIVIQTPDSNYKYYDSDVWGYRKNKVDWRIFAREFYRIDYIGEICIYTVPSASIMDYPDWTYFSVDLCSPIYVLSKKNLVDVYHADTAFVHKIQNLNSGSVFKWNRQKHCYKFIEWLPSK